jgi:DNA-directed RNA polymerase subunit alpha
MSVLYGKFEMPEKIKVEESSLTPTFARFIAEPFERGFGHTLGNALRRILLSGLEAPAIISLRFDGVSHEYMAVEGIIEDVTSIILNLKGALLRKLPHDTEACSRDSRIITKMLDIGVNELKESGQYKVTLGDLMESGDFEVVNPDLHLFTVTKPLSKRIDLRIAIGRGYQPAERLQIADRTVDEMLIDGLFSPVRLVNYRVENTRVGQDTDYDRLILEVTTDGRVTPQEALSFSSQIALTHLGVFQGIETKALAFERKEVAVNTDREEMLRKLSQRIDEIELSVRSTNCLNMAGIRYIGELVVMREAEMLQFRNFGKKSLAEIRAKLMSLGLGFERERDLASNYGIDRKNIRDLIEQHLAQRAQAAEAGAAAEATTKVEESYEA